jgi:pyrimidine-specific ribonucleoside hydrolase
MMPIPIRRSFQPEPKRLRICSARNKPGEDMTRQAFLPSAGRPSGLARLLGAGALAGVIAFMPGCRGSDLAADTAGASHPVIIDTDAGADDLMALAYLLASPGIEIEAVTVGLGLANIEPGARNVLRVLELAGRQDIPVHLGRATPLAGDNAFPDAWRALSDELPGVELPEAQRLPEARPAAEFLAERLSDAARPVDVLALGALTNLAEALASDRGVGALRRLVIMGGAVHVPGNLHEAGENENVTAEWNFYVDAEAARRVFEAGLPIRLIPLDATDRVPLDRGYIRELQGAAQSSLARLTSQLLDMVAFLMDEGNYYAWDPLAAVTLVDSTVVQLQPKSIAVGVEAPEEGRSADVPGGRPNATVAIDADARRFRALFVGTLVAWPGREREP